MKEFRVVAKSDVFLFNNFFKGGLIDESNSVLEMQILPYNSLGICILLSTGQID